MASEQRMEVLNRISYLLDVHCEECDVSALNKSLQNAKFATADAYCRKICEIGLELKQCGDKLSEYRR